MALKPSSLTQRLRLAGAGFWAIAMGLALYSQTIAYICFGLAAVLCYWAEKREFSTRVLLYRMHDLVIYTPWKYLLLHFLWIGVVGSFWHAGQVAYGLLAIALPAHFLFSRMGEEGTALALDFLKLPFIAFACATIFLALGFALGWVSPDGSALYLYFSLGFPFLAWDCIQKRRLLPAWLAGIALVAGAATLYLVRPRACVLTLAATAAFFAALMLYKRLRPGKFLLALFASGIAALVLIWLARYSEFLQQSQALAVAALDAQRAAAEEKFALAQENIFLGAGIGKTQIRSGLALRILAESGLVGLTFYGGFFLSLLWRLFSVRRRAGIVASNVAFLSVFVYLGVSRHYLTDPYGVGVWVWYAIWAVLASSHRKAPQTK